AAHVAIHIRAGITGTPIDQVQFGIVGARDPRRSSSALPRISRPSLGSRLAFARHSAEVPHSFSGIRVVGINETWRAKLRACDSGNDEILHHQWSCRRAIALLVVCDRSFPEGRTGFRIERDQYSFNVHAKQFVSTSCKSAIHLPATQIEFRWWRGVRVPDRTSGKGI